MKLCKHCVDPVCDFCFNFNANEKYEDDGWCKALKKETSRDEGHKCDEFDCVLNHKDDKIKETK
jgi:hypothetical protein